MLLHSTNPFCTTFCPIIQHASSHCRQWPHGISHILQHKSLLTCFNSTSLSSLSCYSTISLSTACHLKKNEFNNITKNCRTLFHNDYFLRNVQISRTFPEPHTKIDSTNSQPLVRLSKLMSELGICSRRKAARILKDTCIDQDAQNDTVRQWNEVIYVRGEPMTGGTGVKVPRNEKFIEIRSGWQTKDSNEEEISHYISYKERPWEEIRGDTIVLHKPVGYVSGQEEHQHVPAVRFLTMSNFHTEEGNEREKNLGIPSNLRFTRQKNNNTPASSSTKKSIMDGIQKEPTLSGYAPAGRLDIDSTGLLIFTRTGFMARQFIAPDSKISKEYIVTVVPAVQLTAREKEIGLPSLPPPTKNLSALLKGGKRLWNDKKPLKPLLEAEWLENQTTSTSGGTLRLVLQEGRKRQIRRMCREILGMHVVSLVRTSIGPIHLGSLPEGKWRLLKESEFRELFVKRKKKKAARSISILQES